MIGLMKRNSLVRRRRAGKYTERVRARDREDNSMGRGSIIREMEDNRARREGGARVQVNEDVLIMASVKFLINFVNISVFILSLFLINTRINKFLNQ